MIILPFILIPAIGFGGWPVLARLTGLSAAWISILLMAFTTIVMVLYYGRSALSDPINPGQFTAMAGIALLNSIAMITFGVLLIKYPQYVAIAQALMPIVSFFGFWKLTNTPVSTGQVVFMTLACICIAGAGYCTPPAPQVPPIAP